MRRGPDGSGAPQVSLDIFLKRFADDPAGEAEREAVHAVLRQQETCGPDDYGTYFVTLKNGVAVELLAQELKGVKPFEGCAFRIRRRELCREVCELVLEVARAANCVILPVISQFLPILVTADQAARLPPVFAQRYRVAPVCSK